MHMVKGRTTISIDSNLIEKAQRAQINISGLTESAIRKKLDNKIVEIEKPLKCAFCGKVGPKEAPDMVPKSSNIKDDVINPHHLIWIYPDEKWACNKCLRIRVSKIPVAHK
jgi:hypothetical protein